MATLGVRSGSLAVRSPRAFRSTMRFERTGANGYQRSGLVPKLRVVSSSLIARSHESPPVLETGHSCSQTRERSQCCGYRMATLESGAAASTPGSIAAGVVREASISIRTSGSIPRARPHHTGGADGLRFKGSAGGRHASRPGRTRVVPLSSTHYMETAVDRDPAQPPAPGNVLTGAGVREPLSAAAASLVSMIGLPISSSSRRHAAQTGEILLHVRDF